MVLTCVDSVLEQLAWLNTDPRWTLHLKDQIQALQQDLRFFKMFLSSFATWDDVGKNVNLRSSITKIEATMEGSGNGLYAAGFLAIDERRFKDLELVVSKLLEKVELCKPGIKEICIQLLHGSLQCWDSTSNEILEFIDAILMNLKDLISSKADIIFPVKNQIGALEEKLRLFRNIVDFTEKRCTSNEQLRDFRIHVQTWATNAACLSTLYWVNNIDEEMASRMNLMLSDLLQKIKPCTPKVTRMYFGVLKASKSLRSDTTLMGEFVASFIDFLLENLVVSVEDCNEILREGLIFLITFLADPPEEYDEGKLIQVQTQADTVLSEAAHIVSSLCSNEMKDDIVLERMTALIDFLKKIDTVKAKVRKDFVPISSSSRSNFPMVNGLGFIDALLRNLENQKEMLKCNTNFLPCAKGQILAIEEKLVSLRLKLEDISKLQNGHDDVKHLWMQIINAAYQAEISINSCWITDIPIWYNMICLSYVTEEIKLLNTEVKKVTDNQMYRIGILSQQLDSSHLRTSQGPTSGIDEVVVGFEGEAETIIDRLTRGSAQLEVVSIVGMPGLGKTTLAKKVYYHRSVQYYFTKCAWCTVSQMYEIRELLLVILSDLLVIDDQIRKMKKDELDDKLRKCLKGQRYLIVMDDIWDIRAWDELKMSFPNDYKGSRIVFTTRNQNVALQAKSGSIPHSLRFLSDDESWELLREKIFHKDECPKTLSKVGRQIAKNCKGLPLSIVLVAGILARTEKSLDCWNEIAKTIGRYIAKEGCMDLLELSYKFLPEFLKSCFLYFGAFVEDKKIRVRKLVLLWIGEGFVQQSEMNSLQEVAKEYLKELVERSLVIVTDRSSNGGIKACRVHDLLRDFCISKAKEENFLWPLHGNDAPPYTLDLMNQYRMSIETNFCSLFTSKRTCSFVRSLIFSFKNKCSIDPDGTSLFSNLKLLQVLDLEDVPLDKFPNEIALLVHLRYLVLHVDSRYVPSSIANLWKLEIFVMKNDRRWGIWLPGTIWKMKRLRHLDVGRNGDIPLGDYELEVDCQLDQIETFSSAALAHGEYAEKLLKRLPNVRKLSCQFQDSWNFRRQCNQLPILDFLSKLESLNLIYCGKVLYPCAFSFPSTLKKLSMSDFRLPWSEISAIAKLPNLEVLKLLTDAFVGERWDMKDEEFSKLKFLKLSGMTFSEWNASDDSFPCLETLRVTWCRRLLEIPHSLGDISTLKVIEVYWCNYSTEHSARKIQAEQLELGNEGLEVLITH